MNEKGWEQPETESSQDSGKEAVRPYAKVTFIRPVVRDGWYNAFTDLAYWKDMYWLCYRRGTTHGAGNSVEVVLRSNDLRRWREVNAFESPYGIEGGCSAADGHFCPTPDRLYIIIGTRNPLHAFASWTADGVRWSEPEVLTLGDHYPYTWRVRWHEGRFYSAVNHFASEQQPRLDLIVSDDAVHWTRHGEIASGQPPGFPNYPDDGFSEESELHWRPDGELWCVVRTAAAVMYYARPPYTEWHGGLVLYAGCDAPVMCECGGEVYLAGRAAASWQGVPNPDGTKPFELQNPFGFYPNPFTRTGTTGVYRLRRDRADLLVTFPPGSDTSYPGLVSLEPGKLIISYYSDVAYVSGQARPMHFPEYVHKASECDIYIAEVEVGEQSV